MIRQMQKNLKLKIPVYHKDVPFPMSSWKNPTAKELEDSICNIASYASEPGYCTCFKQYLKQNQKFLNTIQKIVLQKTINFSNLLTIMINENNKCSLLKK